jgi:hypothetical protein
VHTEQKKTNKIVRIYVNFFFRNGSGLTYFQDTSPLQSMRKILSSEDTGGAWTACAKMVVWEEVVRELRAYGPPRYRLLIHHSVPKHRIIINYFKRETENKISVGTMERGGHTQILRVTERSIAAVAVI